MANQLSRNALIIYTRNLRTLEFIKHQCNNSLKKINSKEQQLQNELENAQYNRPRQAMNKPNFWTSLFTAMLSAILVLIGGGAVALIFALILWDLLPIILAVIFAIAIIGGIVSYKNEQKAYLADQQRFANETREYNNDVAYCQAKLNQFMPEAQKRTKILNAYIKQIDNQLQKAYSLNIIPKQFRDIYGVTYLYDFLSTCQLGLQDAILNYQLDRIRSQLDVIISKCDEIIGQMRRLNSNVNEIRMQNNQLLQEARNISHNAELSAQYSEITAINSEVSLELQKKQLAYQEVDFWLNKI